MKDQKQKKFSHTGWTTFAPGVDFNPMPECLNGFQGIYRTAVELTRSAARGMVQHFALSTRPLEGQLVKCVYCTEFEAAVHFHYAKACPLTNYTDLRNADEVFEFRTNKGLAPCDRSSGFYHFA